MLNVSDLEAVTDDQSIRITAAEENIQGKRVLLMIFKEFTGF